MSDASALQAAWRWATTAARAAVLLPSAMLLWHVDHERGRRLAARWAQRALDEFGVAVRVHDHSGGRAERGGCLFIHLNQTSLVETLTHHLVFGHVRWVINFEFALLPLLGWAPWAMGGVVLRRHHRAQATRALKTVEAGLRRGDSFGISIEGKRVRPGEAAPFKKGPAVLAIAAQADIVPFVVHGADRVWPYGEWRVRPGTIEIELLAPIVTRGMTYADRDALVAELRRRAAAALGGGS
jgi:1-acyl-sn-glycerol-3-phosphate acyltransferase